MTFIGLMFNGISAASADPTDSAIYFQRRYKNDPKKLEEYTKGLKYDCLVCKYTIQENTKHCGPCNRCCHKFDHHCGWLNNCVGEANFSSFIYSTVFLALYMVASIVLILLCHPNRFRWHVYIPISLDFVGFIFSTELIIWHLYFYLKGITTYTHFQFKKLQREKLQKLKNKEISE